MSVQQSLPGKKWNTLIKNALVFDGTGAPPVTQDIAISRGKIAARDNNLPDSDAEHIVDASGQWVMPGLLDIHTHLDLEVELDPRLPEVVRHGTTTVLVGNCSLGVSFGKQTQGDQNPIVDCFTRVENIPKPVLQQCVDTLSWDNTGDYLAHFNDIALGPNIAAFVPHSMLRVQVMGLHDSVSRKATGEELIAMEELLEKAMEQGYLGLSTDGLPFHYLANDPHKDKRIPTQFAQFRELKRLLHIVRNHDRVWQATPFIENKLLTLFYFLFTSGLIYGKTLKTSALAAVDFVATPGAVDKLLGFARLMNTPLFKGNMHFQALSTAFRMWGDGIVSPMFEELESTSQLIAKEYEDKEGRLALLNDPEFIAQFREDWYRGTQDFSWAKIRAKLGIPDANVCRDLSLMVFDGAPVAQWDGETMQAVFDRLRAFQRGDSSAARSDDEQAIFTEFPNPIADDAEFILHLLRTFDKSFRWWTDVANTDKDKVRSLLLDSATLPGFNDSGAHLTNLAFFDGNLISLQLAQQQSLHVVSQMVKRLTREPAEFFGLDVGSLSIGAQADITIVDPEALAQYDTTENRKFIHRDIFQHQQLVNRSEGVVSGVYINGERVWDGGQFCDALGSKTLGRALRAGARSAA